MECGEFAEYEQIKSQKVCWCKGAKHIMEVEGMPDLIAHYDSRIVELKSSINTLIEEARTSILEEIRKVLNQPLFLGNSGPSPNASSLPQHAESTSSKKFELQFKGVPESLLTMTKLDDEGTSVEVELLDDSGNRVEDGTESALKIKIDVLNGDFDVEDIVDWTNKDYINNIAKPRDGKGSILKGKCKMVLNKGVAGVGHLCFTDNSKSMRNGTFRLGATAENYPSVKPAVSEAFKVKERRLKSDLKHKVPNPEDELFRLIHIRKNGAVHVKALKEGIRTVEDFNRRYDNDAKELQQILGVHGENWKKIVKNAKACKLPHRGNESCRNKNDFENYVHSSGQQEPEQLKQPLPQQQSPAPLPPSPPNGDFIVGGLLNSSNVTVGMGMENDTDLANENTIQQIADNGTEFTTFYDNEQDLYYIQLQALLGGIGFEQDSFLLDLPTVTEDGAAANMTNPMEQALCDFNKLSTKYYKLFSVVKLVALAKRCRSQSRNGEIDHRPEKKQKI